MLKNDLLNEVSWICRVQESIRMEDPPVEVKEETPPPPPETPVEGEAKVEEEPKPKDAPAWASERIDDLTKNWRKEERARQAKETELEVVRAQVKELEAKLNPSEPGKTPAKPGPIPLSDADRNKAIQEEAEKIVAQRELESQIAAASDEGAKEFGEEFEKRCANFTKIGGYPITFLQACIETGQAHRILHKLGGDLDQASKILKMPPIKQAVALSKLADEVAAAPKVSGAPRPIKPVNGNGGTGTEELTDELSTAEWMRRRQAQVDGRKTKH